MIFQLNGILFHTVVVWLNLYTITINKNYIWESELDAMELSAMKEGDGDSVKKVKMDATKESK